MRTIFLYASLLAALLSGCSSPKNEETIPSPSNQSVSGESYLLSFNEDSAYKFIEDQLAFGPRVPGTLAHQQCADYFFKKLNAYSWKTQMQYANIITHDKKQFVLKNIIAEYKPELAKRIFLTAHWDTRPWADNDSVNTHQPADGADDGASGAAVLLEIARQINALQPAIGVDILLNDLEDYGKENDGGDNTWCLGTQYWAKNPHKVGYTAQYAIVLDMVGAKEAAFPKEDISREYASPILKKVWNHAAHLGYSHYFLFKDLPYRITDDHLYINTLAKIPCIDIINMNPVNGSFGDYHHRHSDNIHIIDRNTLKAVGMTVLKTLLEEQTKSN